MGPLSDILRDIAAQPAPFLAELVQSALLLGVIWWFGRRWAGKRLRERQAKVASALAEAGQAERDSVRLREEARVLAEGLASEAAEIIRTAKEQAERERDAAIAQVETEAGELITRARQSVEREKVRVLQEGSDRLVHLTSEAARRYLDEILTESERRALMQKAILASLEVMEGKRLPTDAEGN
jgi:F0F1-type ATP synthase membrane subunit b/b'